jgi:AbrB family looped-hinge helix DNA binding protein
MAVEAKVSRKWQVVIPKEIRERLSLRPGDRISFEVSGVTTTIRKEKDSPFDRYFGFLGKGISTDKLIRQMRGDR